MSPSISRIYRQSFSLPSPELTEKNLPDQYHRVHLVTGGYSGIGFELVKILYSHNATVFIAGRDAERGRVAIRDIEELYPESKGELEFVFLDLSDLASIKKSAEHFTSRSDRLHVLTNNAGVMVPPLGQKTAQGFDYQLGVNCLGPFLLTALLMPTLVKTADTLPPGSVRVTWAASVAVETSPPQGLEFTHQGDVKFDPKDSVAIYTLSKVGNALLALETARQHAQHGIISVAWNPGNLRTPLQRHMPGWQYAVARLILHEPVYGAYTMLYAACSPSLGMTNNGSYILPWGRIGDLRNDIADAARPVNCGGQGKAAAFWRWCNERIRQYV